MISQLTEESATTASTGRPISLTRNTLGGVIGNILEWYDFAVFGFFAPIIGRSFFPTDDPTAGLLNAFGVFAAGYLMRPLGGLIFGHIGDKYGRKLALTVSVLMMALPTTLLGLLPTYDQIGLTASVLLIVLRLIQGISVGGELIGSVAFITEIAPKGRKGLFGSLSACSSSCGIMFGSLIAALIHGLFSPAALNAYGWRIPFLMGLLIGLLGLWLRRDMTETPDFEQARLADRIERSPVVEAIRTRLRTIGHLALLMVGFGGGYYMLFVWWPTYLTNMVKPPIPHALAVNTAVMTLLLLLTPLMGHLSDRIGRRAMMLLGNGGLALIALPLFFVTDHAFLWTALGAQAAAAMVFSSLSGSVSTLMVEMFPARMRYSGAAMGYNITLALIGGTAPLICTWLVKASGVLYSPAFYLIALTGISFAAALKLPVLGNQDQTEAAGESERERTRI